MMDLASISFSFIFLLFFFYFLLFFIFKRVQDKEDKKHDTVTEVTCSHDTEKSMKGFGTK